jgi:hypothetical protein
MIYGKSLAVAAAALAGLLGLSGCAGGSSAVVVTETATVTASPTMSTPEPPDPSNSAQPTDAAGGEKASYGEIRGRLNMVLFATNELFKAPTLPQAREKWDDLEAASKEFIDLIVMDFAAAGGGEMRTLVAEFAEALVVFVNSESKIIDDRAYCENAGSNAAQKDCLRSLSDPAASERAFEKMTASARSIADALPG